MIGSKPDVQKELRILFFFFKKKNGDEKGARAVNNQNWAVKN